MNKLIKNLCLKYSFLKLRKYGESVMSNPLYCVSIGVGKRKVFYSAAHHGNEWITTYILLRFIDDYSLAYAENTKIYGISAREIFENTTIYLAPLVNPDGVEIARGALDSGPYFARALEISKKHPLIPFPYGWKANALGIDLNLQYPAGWETARENKAKIGISAPAPRDYTGRFPLCAPESSALYDLTEKIDPALVLAFHTQGRVIYWKYKDLEPEGSRGLAAKLSEASGYEAEDTPYASGFAGYKDWFISQYNRPGFTIEAGLGDNPLPMEQFEQIYSENLGIMVISALG